MAAGASAIPDIGIELHASQQVVDLQREGFHAALRTGAGPWRGLRRRAADRLAADRRSARRRRRAACSARDAGGAGRRAAARPRPDLGTLVRAGRRSACASSRWPSSTTPGMMLQAAEQDLGLALAREVLAADALRDGRLVRLSPLALRGRGAYAYWLVYPPDAARLAAAAGAARAGCATNWRAVAEPASRRRASVRQEQRLQVATGSRSRARVGRTPRAVALDQAAALRPRPARASMADSGRPVRSAKRASSKPSRRRSALSMNSNGSCAARHLLVVGDRLARPAPAPCRSPARASAPGAPRGAGSSACRARRRRCRGSRRTASSSGCARSGGRAARRPRPRSAPGPRRAVRSVIRSSMSLAQVVVGQARRRRVREQRVRLDRQVVDRQVRRREGQRRVEVGAAARASVWPGQRVHQVEVEGVEAARRLLDRGARLRARRARGRARAAARRRSSARRSTAA